MYMMTFDLRIDNYLIFSYLYIDIIMMIEVQDEAF